VRIKIAIQSCSCDKLQLRETIRVLSLSCLLLTLHVSNSDVKGYKNSWQIVYYVKMMWLFGYV
jgi:hypothetical protein